ncbi:MAG: hypothetical protein IJS54_07365 [Desulfovibrio sp.]|nr:hypothetical protein [Desulfovibrio sp.]
MHPLLVCSFLFGSLTLASPCFAQGVYHSGDRITVTSPSGHRQPTHHPDTMGHRPPPPPHDMGHRPPQHDMGHRPPQHDMGHRPPQHDMGHRPPPPPHSMWHRPPPPPHTMGYRPPSYTEPKPIIHHRKLID